MAALAKFTFEWVLPGHGERVKQPPEQMQAQLGQLLARMRQPRR
jgi:hypothetical protein